MSFVSGLNKPVPDLYVFVRTVQPTVDTLQALLDITSVEALQV